MIAHEMIDIGRREIFEGHDLAGAGQQRQPLVTRLDVEIEAEKGGAFSHDALQHRSFAFRIFRAVRQFHLT